jgi:hypothetical protein
MKGHPFHLPHSSLEKRRSKFSEFVKALHRGANPDQLQTIKTKPDTFRGKFGKHQFVFDERIELFCYINFLKTQIISELQARRISQEKERINDLFTSAVVAGSD